MGKEVVGRISRRRLVKEVFAGAAVLAADGAAASYGQDTTSTLGTSRKGRIRQSVSKWCFPKIPLDELARFGAGTGLQGVDLLQPQDWEIPTRYGLICTMGYAGLGSISAGLNRVSNHEMLEASLRKNAGSAAKNRVPNLILYSGTRNGMTDDEGLKNSVVGLNRLKKIAEDNGVVLCVELLNSKVNHPDYMADSSAWGLKLVQEVNSPNVKLLYDIYHMQIMEGDLIQTIQRNIQWFAHFHTAGVPGRHELNGDQEVRWDGVMRAIVAAGYKGYVAHEFLPTSSDPLQSLKEAVDLCDV